MGLGKGVLVTWSYSLTNVKKCPLKLQVVTVVVGQNVCTSVVWNINDKYSVFILLKLF